MASVVGVSLTKGFILLLGYFVLIGAAGFSGTIKWIVLLMLGIWFFSRK